MADLLRAVKAIRRLKEGEAKVIFPSLGEPSGWRIVGFSHAAHANLSDGVSSTAAHLVLLLGQNGRCCPLAWQANKIRRVVRSTLAAEALSLQEALEDGCFLRRLLDGGTAETPKVLSITKVWWKRPTPSRW